MRKLTKTCDIVNQVALVWPVSGTGNEHVVGKTCHELNPFGAFAIQPQTRFFINSQCVCEKQYHQLMI